MAAEQPMLDLLGNILDIPKSEASYFILAIFISPLAVALKVGFTTHLSATPPLLKPSDPNSFINLIAFFLCPIILNIPHAWAVIALASALKSQSKLKAPVPAPPSPLITVSSAEKQRKRVSSSLSVSDIGSADITRRVTPSSLALQSDANSPERTNLSTQPLALKRPRSRMSRSSRTFSDLGTVHEGDESPADPEETTTATRVSPPEKRKSDTSIEVESTPDIMTETRRHSAPAQLAQDVSYEDKSLNPVKPEPNPELKPALDAFAEKEKKKTTNEDASAAVAEAPSSYLPSNELSPMTSEQALPEIGQPAVSLPHMIKEKPSPVDEPLQRIGSPVNRQGIIAPPPTPSKETPPLADAAENRSKSPRDEFKQIAQPLQPVQEEDIVDPANIPLSPSRATSIEFDTDEPDRAMSI